MFEISTELKELGDKIRENFGKEIATTLKKRENSGTIQQEYEIVFNEPGGEARHVVIEEDLTHGQRIESFQILRESEGYQLYPIYQGSTVGNRKICTLWDPAKDQNPLLFGRTTQPTHLVLRITSARGEAFLKSVKIY